MPSKAAAEAYRFHVLSGHRELFEQVESQICEAFKKEFSVIEITRIIGSRKADYAHSILVKNGVIKRGKPGRAKKGSIPTVIAPYLRKRSLSYAKWCAGWNFDLEETARAITENVDGRVMEAVRRDFPGCYAKIRKLKTFTAYVHPPKCESDKLEANISWDNTEYCYRAAKMSDGAVRGYGHSMEYAIRNLKISHNFRLMIRRITEGCEV